jgi:ribose transport system permease protein
MSVQNNTPPAPSSAVDSPASGGFRFPKVGKEVGILGILILLCAVVTLKNPLFLSVTNLANMSQLIGMYGIFSIGMGIVIITGGIDLSVGSMFALLGVLLAMMLSEWHWTWPIAILATLAGGAVLGVIHGLLITRLKLQPFIVTLCGLLFYRGVARFIAHDETKGFGDAKGFEFLQRAATGNIHGVPIPFIIMLVVAVIMWVALHRSVWGRYLYAVGRNEDAALYSGINTRRIISGAYVLSGVFAGMTSILLAFYTNSVSPSSHGNSYELYAVAAAVLGGCSLRGGEGSIFGIIIGTILLQVLQNLVNLLGIDSSLNFAVMGAVILIGVIADQLFQSRKKKT